MNTHDIELPAEFRSGNDIPVTVATIKRERMEEILNAAIETDRKRRGEPVALTSMQRQMIRNVIHEVGQRSRFKGDYHDQVADLLTSIASAPQPAEPSDETAAMEAVMESIDPATWPGLTSAQRCALGRFAKPQPAEPYVAPMSDKPVCGAQNGKCETQPANPAIKESLTVAEPVKLLRAVDTTYDKPQIGSTWLHYNGNLYTVEGFTNEHSERLEKYPVTIHYRGENGHAWSRPLSRWFSSMTFVRPAEPVKKKPYAQGSALSEFGIIPTCDQVNDEPVIEPSITGLVPVSTDNQRFALWQAIGSIRVGTKWDDESILRNLHDAGYVIACRVEGLGDA